MESKGDAKLVRFNVATLLFRYLSKVFFVSHVRLEEDLYRVSNLYAIIFVSLRRLIHKFR